jgi:hypothetical protein
MLGRLVQPSGFAGQDASEAIAGALPDGQSSPQLPPFGIAAAQEYYPDEFVHPQAGGV